MSRIDQSLGRGSGSSRRAQRKPVNVTGTVASQMITPPARTQDEDPNASAMRPAVATTSPRYPRRRAQTAIFQCPLCCSSGGSSMPGIDRKSTRLNSSHVRISYAVFCLKKKKKKKKKKNQKKKKKKKKKQDGM